MTYLVATAFRYEDVRLYPVHRILDARFLEGQGLRPPAFSIDKYIKDGAMQFGAGKKIKIRAHITEDLAQILIETPLSEDMKVTKTGEAVLLRATVLDSWQLRWWILSQGASLEILQPESLRGDIGSEVLKMFINYRKHSDSSKDSCKRQAKDVVVQRMTI